MGVSTNSIYFSIEIIILILFIKVPFKKVKTLLKIIILPILAFFTSCTPSGFTSTSTIDIPDIKWTMVNVNSGTTQGDAHVIQVKGGKTVLIDAGTQVSEQLMPFLEKKYKTI